MAITEKKVIENIKNSIDKNFISHIFQVCKHFSQLREELCNMLSEKDNQRIAMRILSLECINELLSEIHKLEEMMLVFDEKKEPFLT